MPLDPDRILRIASRLNKVERGSPEADAAIHHVLALAGPQLDYTTDTDAAGSLLPKGFEWTQPTYSADAVYAACRRKGLGADGLNHPHVGQWGRTLALAMAGTAVRSHVLALGLRVESN